VIVLIGEVQPARLWERMLKNRRDTIVARRLSRSTDAVVCRYRMPLRATMDRSDVAEARAGSETVLGAIFTTALADGVVFLHPVAA